MPFGRALTIATLALTPVLLGAAQTNDKALHRVTIRGEVGAKLDRYLARAVPFGFSGTVLVADAQGILLHKGYGMADESRRLPNSVNTVFDMGSITKALTATAILRLEDEGKLSVNDRIEKYFDVPADKKEVTLHQLLTHTSGFTSDVGGDYDDIPKALALQRMLAAPLASTPGKEFRYSNAGFSMLAAILEKVTAEEYETHMRRRFFHPAGMKSTGYRLVKWKPGVVAHNYTQRNDLGTPLERLLRSNGPNWNLMGNGGVLTTAADLYRWELAYSKGRLLSPAQQAKQFSPQFRRTPQLANGYDWWLEESDGDTATAFHRGGDSPAYALNAEYRRYPNEKITIILLANNRLKGWSSRRYVVPNIRKMLLGREVAVPPAVRSLRDAGGFHTRVYEAADGRFVVEPAGDHLRLLVSGQSAVDALTFFRAPTSLATRRRLNTRAEEFIAALQSGDKGKVAPFIAADQADTVLSAWQREVEQRRGLSKVEVLGTARLDRGQFLTTLRLHFGAGPVPVRFCWASNRVDPNSDDTTFPAFTPVMRVSPVDAALETAVWSTGTPDEFVSHDLLTAETLKLTFEQGSIEVHLSDGLIRVPLQGR